MFKSHGWPVRLRGDRPVCRLYDREELPWPSCSLQWKGKQPRAEPSRKRFVAGLGRGSLPVLRGQRCRRLWVRVQDRPHHLRREARPGTEAVVEHEETGIGSLPRTLSASTQPPLSFEPWRDHDSNPASSSHRPTEYDTMSLAQLQITIDGELLNETVADIMQLEPSKRVAAIEDFAEIDPLLGQRLTLAVAFNLIMIRTATSAYVAGPRCHGSAVVEQVHAKAAYALTGCEQTIRYEVRRRAANARGRRPRFWGLAKIKRFLAISQRSSRCAWGISWPVGPATTTATGGRAADQRRSK